MLNTTSVMLLTLILIVGCSKSSYPTKEDVASSQAPIIGLCVNETYPKSRCEGQASEGNVYLLKKMGMYGFQASLQDPSTTPVSPDNTVYLSFLRPRGLSVGDHVTVRGYLEKLDPMQYQGRTWSLKRIFIEKKHVATDSIIQERQKKAKTIMTEFERRFIISQNGESAHRACLLHASNSAKYGTPDISIFDQGIFHLEGNKYRITFNMNTTNARGQKQKQTATCISTGDENIVSFTVEDGHNSYSKES